MFFCGHDGTITIEEQDPEHFDPRLGDQLGEYVLVAHVADGAMGRVYEARHKQSKRRMAVKVLHANVAKDKVAVERFAREYTTAKELDHPHVVDVIDHGPTEDGSRYLTMEYLDGEELSLALDRDAPFALARLLRITCQVAGALAHAHSFGVVHRDLKPDNVFLCRSDEGDVVKLLDFGSVKLQLDTGPKLTALGTTLGSPYYMSPEQAMGKTDVDQRTDVFALGAIVHEMATGDVAFEGSGIAQILTNIVQKDPAPIGTVRAELAGPFEQVVLRALAKDKTARFSTTTEFAAALLTAVGLDGDVDKWAETPVASIERALETARPAALEPATGPGASIATDDADVVDAPPPIHATSLPPAVPRPSYALPKSVWFWGLALVAAGIVVGLVLALGH